MAKVVERVVLWAWASGGSFGGFCSSGGCLLSAALSIAGAAAQQFGARTEARAEATRIAAQQRGALLAALDELASYELRTALMNAQSRSLPPQRSTMPARSNTRKAAPQTSVGVRAKRSRSQVSSICHNLRCTGARAGPRRAWVVVLCESEKAATKYVRRSGVLHPQEEREWHRQTAARTHRTLPQRMNTRTHGGNKTSCGYGRAHTHTAPAAVEGAFHECLRPQAAAEHAQQWRRGKYGGLHRGPTDAAGPRSKRASYSNEGNANRAPRRVSQLIPRQE